MEDEDIGRFRSTFARSMVDAVIDRSSSSVGDDEFGGLSTVGDDFGTEITSLGSGGGRASWSAASWSPLPAASPPHSPSSPEPPLPPHPSFLCSTRLQTPTAITAPDPTASTAATLLQVQVDSLNWQLNQMEVGYKMQRVVLQQILSFLERLPSDLSSANNESNWRSTSHTCSKCGTVQTIPALGSTRRNSLELSPRNINLSDSPVNGLSYTIRPGSSFDHSPLRDISWRRRRRDSSSSAERIGSEAQRLLRTVRSVLAATTPEPNLLGASHGENNSISGRSLNLHTSQQTSFSVPPVSCLTPGRSGEGKGSSGLSESEEEAFRQVSEGGQRLWEGQRAWGGRQKAIRLRGCPKPLQTSASSSSSSSKSYDCQAEALCGGGGNQKGSLVIQCRERLPEEEESGFSSLGSFQDGAKSERVVRGSFHEVGLPDCGKSEGLTVLWV